MENDQVPEILAKDVFALAKGALEQQLWCEEVCTIWPAPIAHELAQLLAMLGNGQDAGGILMQVRDVAEVLLKIITIIAAADLIRHAGPGGKIIVKQQLFSGRLSLGTWHAALAKLADAPREGLLLPELLDLAKTQSAFMQAVGAYIPKRNSDIGHGAYRPDSAELAHCVHEQLLGEYDQFRHSYKGGLDRAFAAVAKTGIWQQAKLHCDSTDGPAFSGAASIKALRSPQHGHEAQMRSLFLVRGVRSLDLSPFLMGRICDECGARDAFLFDSPKSPKPKDDPRFDFLDYANGHKVAVNAGKTDQQLLALADMSDFILTKHAEDARGEFASAEVIKLLDDIMFDSRFISPDWLRECLRAHMQQHRQGIFWLQAPGHIGKTMFLRGLVGDALGNKEREKQQKLLNDETIAIAPFFIKREYRFDITQFANVMETQTRAALRVDARTRLALPTEGTPSELQAGFVSFAREAREATSASRLIIAIDGLDELRDPEGGLSPIDYFPPAASLPDGVTLVLTSRPPAECPPWLRLRLTRGFVPGHQLHHVGVDDPGYIRLLRTYIGRHSGIKADEADFDEVSRAILSRSGSLFLIVSFLCDLIRDGATME
jgi:hypothetical protein